MQHICIYLCRYLMQEQLGERSMKSAFICTFAEIPHAGAARGKMQHICIYLCRYLMQEQLGERCSTTHIFSSFFYRRLTQRVGSKGSEDSEAPGLTYVHLGCSSLIACIYAALVSLHVSMLL